SRTVFAQDSVYARSRLGIHSLKTRYTLAQDSVYARSGLGSRLAARDSRLAAYSLVSPSAPLPHPRTTPPTPPTRSSRIPVHPAHPREVHSDRLQPLALLSDPPPKALPVDQRR